MDKDLYITVSGTVGSGKTTMTQLISGMLQCVGCNNFVITGEDENNVVNTERSYTRRLSQLVENNSEGKMMIHLKSEQMNRKGV